MTIMPLTKPNYTSISDTVAKKIKNKGFPFPIRYVQNYNTEPEPEMSLAAYAETLANCLPCFLVCLCTLTSLLSEYSYMIHVVLHKTENGNNIDSDS